MTEGIEALLGMLESTVPDRDKKSKRAKAVSILTAIVGAIAMARAVDDPILSKEILSAASKTLEAMYLSEGSASE